MQPYPNYLNTNPNPYMDNRMASLQAYQQALYQPQIPMQIQQQGLNGRIVEDFNVITANDVPMDNFGAVFIKADGSELQRRVWGKDGRIVSTSYKPVQDSFNAQISVSSTEREKSFVEALNGVIAKVDALSDKVDEILKARTKTKKEAILDD